MLNININDRRTLLDLIDGCDLISETPAKYDVQCQSLLTRDGKLYMIEYLRSYNDGVREETAEIYEVTARKVVTTVYDRVPDPTRIQVPCTKHQIA